MGATGPAVWDVRLRRASTGQGQRRWERAGIPGAAPTDTGGRDDDRLWSLPYPAVDVDVRTVAGEPADVLARMSQGARTLVVGGPGGRGAERTLFGSTTRPLAWNSGCPVLVARASTTAVDRARRLVGTTARPANTRTRQG